MAIQRPLHQRSPTIRSRLFFNQQLLLDYSIIFHRSLSVLRCARSRALRSASIADSALAGFSGAGLGSAGAAATGTSVFIFTAAGAAALRAGLRMSHGASSTCAI